jgi:hypothetical protein
MSKFVGTILGGLEIAAGVFTGIVAGWTGVGLYIAAQLITAGAGMVLSGVGTLISGSAQQMGQGVGQGIAFASRNPIKSWDVLYGCATTGGDVAWCDNGGGN